MYISLLGLFEIQEEITDGVQIQRKGWFDFAIRFFVYSLTMFYFLLTCLTKCT